MLGRNSSYLNQLDTARSEGDWDAVKALSDKVLKHSSSSDVLCAIACIEADLMRNLENDSPPNLLTANENLSQDLAVFSQRCEALSVPADDYRLRLQLVILHCHILLLQNNIGSVVNTFDLELLQNLSIDAGKSSDDNDKYLDTLIIKGYAIMGIVYEARGNNSQASQIYMQGSNYIKSNGSSTKPAQSIIWSEVLLYRLAGMVASAQTSLSDQVLDVYRTYTQFITNLINNGPSLPTLPESILVKNRLNVMNRHYLYLSALLSQQGGTSVPPNLTSELEEVSKLVEKVLLSSQSIPKANDSNAPVESYVDMILQNWSSMVELNEVTGLVESKLSISMTQKIKDTIYQAIERTFHSRSLLCHLVTITLALGQYEETLAAFQIYLDYEEQYRIQKQSGAQDKATTSSDNDASIIKTISSAIHLFVHVKYDGVKAKELADKLRGWMNTDTSPKVKSTSFNAYNKLIASVYSNIGAAYFLYSQQSAIVEDHLDALALAIESYQTALSFDSSSVYIYFDYALLLAKSKKITEAVTIAKKGLIIDKTQVALWHLLALLLSSFQNYDSAYKIICNTLDDAVKGADVDSWCDFPTTKKEDLLQLKITQVALIEAYQGVAKAIESVIDVFAMYGKLYTGHGYTKDNSNLGRDSQLEHKSSRSHGNDLRLVRTISKVSKVYTNVRKSFDKIHHRPLNNTTKSNASHQNNLITLRKIWLWTAALYRRGGLLEDSEQAIVEAESINFADPDSRVQLGLLIRHLRPNDALKEFELALEEDSNNLGALLALSLLLLDHIEFGVELNGNDHDKLFISRNDSLAAKARVRAILQQATSRGEARNNPEAWLLLSRAYEQEGDIDGMKKALWRSIELEECRGVRSYDAVFVYYS
ncbi:TPR-like protein [Nadsonia fulvescens var. elongata DSM 6958]|uniref:Cargo-transport protein YPP1 n=1 Tax=Nadsonia fulvescens var. elongata DSM 6958 TaxID=857566 RepID=A0A1E3PNT8_9ASCO|nr:TPR-like protein [Nadsonia fulvescens var. elongata DSM 6958]